MKGQETRGFQSEVKQLLHLMIHSLYSNKEIFLRELISNASDAADKLRFRALSQPDLYEGDGELRVRVSFDKDNRTLTIADNGIGMNREEVIDHLGTIAKSGTKAFLESMGSDQAKDSHLIGQFGKDAASVGFAVVLDELMLALSRQKIDIPTNEEATMVLYEPEYRSTAIRTANALRNINQAVSMMKKETDKSLDDYKAYSRRYHIDHILYVDQDKELTKIDISDDSVRKMPVPEF